MGIGTPLKVLICSLLGPNPMGRPVDRVAGVVLVTDYGALDRALEAKRRQEEAKAEKTED